ncbi:dihydroxyacetone kinase [Naumannella cuiyingiana]|uniref:Dihydroxyacetone kinase n=1 Tax=Naumannella cuiyingiana TaxID=1347891 RepID=A0A7Z0D7P0_9ACTN|nr:dihydroxyacetone kinase [Naumannella cuiyingiana]
MKKLLNNPDDVVTEALEGTALTQPWLALLAGRTIAVRRDRLVTDDNRAELPVALISGGGAGHEPAHAGYVAPGMLTAAVSGAVFASPSVDAICDGIRAVTGDAGALLIVKSYTGDRLNFGLAAELARADGLAVEMVVVADDVALTDDDGNAGRRGLAGTILVHKIAGALAERGAGLAEVAAAARRVAETVGTMGVGLGPATVPGGAAGFELGGDEIELGLGIHGEPGVSREKLPAADELAATMIDRIVADRGLSAGDRVVLLAGNAGATPTMELMIMVRAAARALRERGIEVARVWQGPVLTSIDMPGASLSVLPVDDEQLGALDAPTAAPAWPGGGGSEPAGADEVYVPVPQAGEAGAELGEPDAGVRAAVDRATEALLAAEAELTRLDAEVGDGDLGQALARGARAWQAEPVDGSAAAILRTLSAIARREIGGTSGPLYAAGLLRAGEALAEGAGWPDAFSAGVDGVIELGGAQVGDRTMVDALVPAAEASRRGLDAAIEAARTGAAGTAEQTARRGRSSYLGERVHGHPDPGAVAVVIWLEALRG